MTLLTARDIAYAESGDHTRVWDHLRATAESVDAALDLALGGAGLVLQAGSVTAGPTNSASFTTPVTFPRPFASAPLFVAVNMASGAGATAQWNLRAISYGASGFTVFGFVPSAVQATFTAPCHWLALGVNA